MARSCSVDRAECGESLARSLATPPDAAKNKRNASAAFAPRPRVSPLVRSPFLEKSSTIEPAFLHLFRTLPCMASCTYDVPCANTSNGIFDSTSYSSPDSVRAP